MDNQLTIESTEDDNVDAIIHCVSCNKRLAIDEIKYLENTCNSCESKGWHRVLHEDETCLQDSENKKVCYSKLGDFTIQLDGSPKFRRASLRPIMLNGCPALFLNLDHPKWLEVSEILKEALLTSEYSDDTK